MHLARVGHDAWLWGRDAALIADMRSGVNAIYLPDMRFPPTLRVTADLAEALRRQADVVVAPCRRTACATIARAPRRSCRRGAIVVSATKGSSSDTLFRVSEIVRAGTRARQRSRGGRCRDRASPREVARELPTAVCGGVARSPQRRGGGAGASSARRTFGSTAPSDVVGVEIGGALKNVIAIAAGVAEGLGLGHNAQAGLITRGLAEISRLACAAGAQRDTLAGLTGLGDLVLTCTGALSRNRHVGIELARGRSLRDVLAGMKMVAEGVRTTDAALDARRRATASSCRSRRRWPTCWRAARMPRTALYDLMLRPQRAEAG